MAYTDHVMGGLGDYGRGTMMLRDHGNTIEFYVKVDWSTTNWGSVGWSYWSPNGSADPAGSFGYPAGSAWKLVGSISVTSSGNVSWRVNNTGTSEFRGPHTQTVYIQRATVPPAPTVNAPHSFTHTSFRTNFGWNGDGGSAVDQYEIHYSNTPAGGQVSVITGDGQQLLNVDPAVYPPGTTMYYWVRAHNGVGWGNFNGPQSGTLLRGIRVRVGGVWKHAIPYVKVNGVWTAAVVYIKKAGAWVSTTL